MRARAYQSVPRVLALLMFRHRWFGNHGGPYYPAFWNFSPAGLSIYSVEGDLMKSIPNTEICQTRESCPRGGGNCTMTSSCNYYRATSDGRKNVYATVTGDNSFGAVQGFSMETGMHVGNLETCGFPYNIEYAPHREEIWTHCWSPDEDPECAASCSPCVHEWHFRSTRV